MFPKYESAEHEQAVTTIYTMLGEFVVNFENICGAMRMCVHCAFKREGLTNQLLSQIVVRRQMAGQLQKILWTVYSSLRDQDDDDRKCVKGLIDRFKALSTERNSFMHSEWHLNYDYEDAGDEFFALLVGTDVNENRAPEFKTKSLSVEMLSELLVESKQLLLGFNKLCTCLNQSGFKVSEMLDDRE